MNLVCPCGSTFQAGFVRDELQTLCDRCSLFFERGVRFAAPCWRPWWSLRDGRTRHAILRVVNG